MSVYAGQTLTLQGVGFEAGDVVSFRADAAVFDLPVSGVTAKTARVVIPAAIARESYDVYVVRGAQEQYVATVKIYLMTDQEVPDKEGMNIRHDLAADKAVCRVLQMMTRQPSMQRLLLPSDSVACDCKINMSYQ